MGAAARGCGGGASASGRGSVLDAAAALWDRDSRFTGARGESAFVARVTDGFPATGRSGRDSRRKVRGWIPRRAVRAAGGGGVGTGDAELAAKRRDDYFVGGGSIESGGNPGAGRESARDFGQNRKLSGWRGRGDGTESGGQRGGGVGVLT